MGTLERKQVRETVEAYTELEGYATDLLVKLNDFIDIFGDSVYLSYSQNVEGYSLQVVREETDSELYKRQRKHDKKIIAEKARQVKLEKKEVKELQRLHKKYGDAL